ncbi:MAG: LCP family protein [Lachnospiraceae bacterium]|nr:LCP family protein [Lachnospiraceae bacterium]
MTETGKKLHSKKNDEAMIRRRRRIVLLILGETILCLMLGIVAYGVRVLSSYRTEELDPDVFIETMNYNNPRNRTVEVTDEHGNTTYETVDIPVDTEFKGYRNILVLGVDAEEYNTDVIIIVSINNETGEIRLVSVLRDTLMKMEEGTRKYGYDKANSQYYYGISETISMINRNLGLDIKEYMVVNWFGVATCINQIGGIEMTIPNDFVLSEFNGYLTAVNDVTGIWAPQLPAPGTYLMTGTQVVAFCRIRHYSAWNDFGRTANQREAIRKIFEKVKGMIKEGQIGAVLQVAQTGLGNVKTNMRLPDIMYLAADMGRYSFGETQQFPLKFAANTALANAKYHISDCLMAEDFEGEVRNLHAFLFDDPGYEPSATVKAISREMYNARMGR